MKNLQELIMGNDSDSVAVDARGLHDFLEVGKDFSTWFKDMTDYGFVEGKDFSPLPGKSRGGRPRIEYAMALDMAKEVSMIQRTPKGKQAREYFISMEKRAQQAELVMTPEQKIDLLIETGSRANHRLDNVEERMDDFEENRRLETGDYTTVSRGVSRAVNFYVRDRHLQLTKEQRSALYKDINGGLNQVCGVRARIQIKAKDFDKAMKYIDDWRPSTATKMLIQQTELPLAGVAGD